MSAIQTNLHLRSLINNVETVDELYEVCEEIIAPVLNHTEGMWIELKYCYKAVEIANLCIDSLNHWLNTCQHHKTILKLSQIKAKMQTISNRYYTYHHQQ